jgi:hypothetical protein
VCQLFIINFMLRLFRLQIAEKHVKKLKKAWRTHTLPRPGQRSGTMVISTAMCSNMHLHVLLYVLRSLTHRIVHESFLVEHAPLLSFKWCTFSIATCNMKFVTQCHTFCRYEKYITAETHWSRMRQTMARWQQDRASHELVPSSLLVACTA